MLQLRDIVLAHGRLRGAAAARTDELDVAHHRHVVGHGARARAVLLEALIVTR